MAGGRGEGEGRYIFMVLQTALESIVKKLGLGVRVLSCRQYSGIL